MGCFKIFWDHVGHVKFLQITYDYINENKTMVYQLLIKTEILIPLSCFKTPICKHYYQASHPYSDVEKEYHYYHRPLNTVGMGQNKQDLPCLCSEDVTVLHLATAIFQETYAPLSCNSFTLCKLRYCSYHYMSITLRKTFLSLYPKYSKCHCFVLSPRLRTIPLPGH